MSASPLSIDVIVSDPNIRNGQPLIAGRNLRVSDIIASHIYRGLSPEELAINFALSLGEVHAALAYYYMHKVEMDGQMRADAEYGARLLDELDKGGKLIRFE